MKILILSFYYRPDLCAGSFRTTALVDALRARVRQGTQIDVVTTLPNRYSTYTAEARELEEEPGLSIRRIRLPTHSSDMSGQSKAFLRYALDACRHTKSTRYDLVFATSSRLMTASLGAWIARRCGAKLYLDIRDIFADTIKDVLPRKVAGVAAAFFERLERWSLNGADRINLVSGGFKSYFAARYPESSFAWFTNGIDDEFFAAAEAIDPGHQVAQPLSVLYAGNIGEGQGLHAIIPQLAARLKGRVSFRIIGDGGRRAQLMEGITAAGLDNVQLLPPMGRERLIQEYHGADVLFLHLNAYPAFEKVLPSKLFEYAAMGKPVWAGVSGFAASFVAAEIDNSAVFQPCDAVDAERALVRLTLVDRRRDRFLAKYKRSAIAAELAADILAVAEGEVERVAAVPGR